MIIPLRKRYIKGIQYKSQKSSNGNSGSGNKKRINKAPAQKQLPGTKVQLLNFSGEDQFCAGTGRVLPKRGMAVRHNGELYADYRAAGLAA